MSSLQCQRSQNRQPANGPPLPACRPPALHRIAEVRREQQISTRAMAHRMNTTVAVVDRQQVATCDLTLSDLYKWQAALDVPVADLLVEPDLDLSPCVRRRAELLKVMKTVRLMEHHTEEGTVRSLLRQLRDQLTATMPELKHVEAWPKVGQRRSANEIAPIEERLVPAWLVDGE